MCNEAKDMDLKNEVLFDFDGTVELEDFESEEIEMTAEDLRVFLRNMPDGVICSVRFGGMKDDEEEE